MEDFEIEKQSEPPSDYVSWSLNNFKVEDVADHSGLCSFDPWDTTDSCGPVPDLHHDTKSDFHTMNTKCELGSSNVVKTDDFNHSNVVKTDVFNRSHVVKTDDDDDFHPMSYDKPDLRDVVKVEVGPVKMDMNSAHAGGAGEFVMPEKIDAETTTTLVTEDKLSTVDLGHICEIVGNKEDPEQAKQFICLYCGLQLGWNHLCFHMKFGHNNHDKVKLCKRFDCEYHSKMKTGTDADMSVCTSSTSMAVAAANNNNAGGGGGGGAKQTPPSSDNQEPCRNGMAMETATGAGAEIRQCPDCAFVTSKKASLREHIKYHHPKEEEPELHRCLICGFQTKYKYGLKKHAKKHSKLTLHKCPCCDYSTILPLLLEHIKFKHTDEQLAWSSMASGAGPLSLPLAEGLEQAAAAAAAGGAEGTAAGAQLEIRPLGSLGVPTGSGPAATFQIMPSLQLPQ